MQRLAVLAAVALVLALASGSEPADSCTAERGRTCESAVTGPRQKVAEALAADRPAPEEEPQLELLQRSAGGVEKAQAAKATKESGNVSRSARASSNVSRSARSQVNRSAGQVAALARAVRALEAAYANRSRTAQRSNYSRGKDCSAYTGGMCFLTGECSESRQAECQSSFCMCPDYTCNNNGKCELSPTEIANAVKNGVAGVAEKVTNIAQSVPGIADSVSGIFDSVRGISDTLSGIIGSLTGADMGDCSSRYVGTCLWSECNPDLGYTVSCEWGSCQCLQGFCAQNGKCMVDIASIVASTMDLMR